MGIQGKIYFYIYFYKQVYKMKFNLMYFNISATISDQHQFTSKEFEDVIKEWFRQGGQRLSRQQKDSEEVNPQVI